MKPRPLHFERKGARPRARFTDDVVEEAVRIYVQGLSSYRVLAAMLEQRLGRPVSRFTLNNRVLELGARAKSPLETSIELAPKWGGFLGIDDKVIFINGKQHCLLIGVDHPTQDLVHALVLPVENADGFARLETEARLDAGYPLLGVVSDFGPGFAQTHRDHFGAVPFQACRVHFDRRLDSDIPKFSWSKRASLHAEFKDRIRAVLYATSIDEARTRLSDLISERKRFKGTGRVDSLRALERNFDLYTAPHARVARRQQRHGERHQATQQVAPAHGRVQERRVRGALCAPARRLLPLQTLHGFLPRTQQWQGSPGTCRRRPHGLILWLVATLFFGEIGTQREFRTPVGNDLCASGAASSDGRRTDPEARRAGRDDGRRR